MEESPKIENKKDDLITKEADNILDKVKQTLQNPSPATQQVSPSPLNPSIYENILSKKVV